MIAHFKTLAYGHRHPPTPANGTILSTLYIPGEDVPAAYFSLGLLS